MNLSELLNRRLITQFKADKELVNNTIAIAKNDISSAKKMLEIKEWGWAHNAAFNAMLQTGRSIMFARGYRPMSQEHHVAVVSFMEAVYSGRIGTDLIQSFDRARKRRSESLYDSVGTISETQARTLVSKAEIFVSKGVEIIGKINLS